MVSVSSIRQFWTSLERVTVVSPVKGSEMAFSSSQSPLQANNRWRKTQELSALGQAYDKQKGAPVRPDHLENSSDSKTNVEESKTHNDFL